MPHILFVLDYYKPHFGGSETVFENIITRLLRKGYKISVITSWYDSKLKKLSTKDNLTIYRVGKGRKSFLITAFLFGIKFLRQNKDVKIIHTSTYGGAIPASLMGFFCKRKVIITVHEVFDKLWYLYKGKIKGFFYRIFERHIFHLKYDIYHCVSRYTLNSLRVGFGIPDSKLRMIYNGVDTIFWNAFNVTEDEIINWKNENNWKGRYVLLYFGHTGISKGIDHLIDAIPRLVEASPDIMVVFNLIPAKRDSYIKSKIKNLKGKINGKEELLYPDYIQIFNGFKLHELRILLASVDCVIAPSLSEGFGSVHTETCAMSKTLITTNVASIPEVVRGQVKFIKPGSVGEIVKGVEKVRRGDFELIFQKEFSWDDTVNEIEQIYKKL